jgi:hypothetical protein
MKTSDQVVPRGGEALPPAICFWCGVPIIDLQLHPARAQAVARHLAIAEEEAILEDQRRFPLVAIGALTGMRAAEEDDIPF